MASYMRGYAAIGLINSKTEENVGGAMRACACYGVSAIVVEGARYRKIATDVSSAFKHIPVFHVDDVWKYIPYDAVPVVVELVPGAENLIDFKHPERAFYIFGPEDGNVPERIITRCSNVVMIPMV